MKTNSPEFQKILSNVKRSGYLSEITKIANEVVLFYPLCLAKLGQNTDNYSDEFEATRFIINGILNPLKDISQKPEEHFEIGLLKNIDLEKVRSHRAYWNEMFTEYALRYDLWAIGSLSNEEIISHRAITNMEISEIFDVLEQRFTN